MLSLAVAALLLGSSPGVVAPKLGRMEIVADQALARANLRSHGVAFDEVFPLPRSEARKVRAAIVPYLRAKVREASEGDRSYFETILAHISEYRWYCAGHAYKKERRLFCVALSPGIERDFPRLAGGGLPLVLDGGIAILNVLFDVDRRAVETFGWNGEA
jgi:hypothetical protein